MEELSKAFTDLASRLPASTNPTSTPPPSSTDPYALPFSIYNPGLAARAQVATLPTMALATAQAARRTVVLAKESVVELVLLNKKQKARVTSGFLTL